MDNRRRIEVGGDQTSSKTACATDAGVNDIIVKIEMKKFQNLIANKIKHKNNLLQADMLRVYPLSKKGAERGAGVSPTNTQLLTSEQ